MMTFIIVWEGSPEEVPLRAVHLGDLTLYIMRDVAAARDSAVRGASPCVAPRAWPTTDHHARDMAMRAAGADHARNDSELSPVGHRHISSRICGRCLARAALHRLAPRCLSKSSLDLYPTRRHAHR